MKMTVNPQKRNLINPVTLGMLIFLIISMAIAFYALHTAVAQPRLEANVANVHNPLYQDAQAALDGLLNS